MGVDGEMTDQGIIAQLYRTEDLGELLQSIESNGYLDIEPLIVLSGGEKFTVLEGNRRLAAIMLLRDPELSKRITDETRIQISVPDIDSTCKDTLNRVSVYRVEKRDDSSSFIGFKHINGAAKWESYAKAKFAADWYRDRGIPLSVIANRIGDRHNTVKRMVNAIYVLEQAQNEGVFNLDNRFSSRFSFSHLYTALSRAPYIKFLHLEEAWSQYDPKPNPVAKESLARLEEIFRWLYGSRDDDLPPVIKSQNPDIKYLAEILDSREALTVLRATHSLLDAHASTHSADQKFAGALVRARREVREISNNLRGFDGRDTSLVDIAEEVFSTAQAIYEHMKKKMRDASDDNG